MKRNRREPGQILEDAARDAKLLDELVSITASAGRDIVTQSLERASSQIPSEAWIDEARDALNSLPVDDDDLPKALDGEALKDELVQGLSGGFRRVDEGEVDQYSKELARAMIGAGIDWLDRCVKSQPLMLNGWLIPEQIGTFSPEPALPKDFWRQTIAPYLVTTPESIEILRRAVCQAFSGRDRIELPLRLSLEVRKRDDHGTPAELFVARQA